MTTPYPVAMIPYANTAPFRLLGEPRGCVFVSEHPSASVASLKRRAVWASCVPVGGLPALADDVEYVGTLGIAATGQAQSVLLFSRVAFGQVADPDTVWVTDHTVSSVRLLYLTLGYRVGFGCLPRQVRDRDGAGALLLIGDNALLARETGRGMVPDDYPHVTDLATEWYARWGLPFVFARWVVRRDAPQAVKEALTEWAEEFCVREEELVARAVCGEAKRLGLSEGRMTVYCDVVRRVLDSNDLRGQDMFLAEWGRHGRQPPFRPATRGPE